MLQIPQKMMHKSARYYSITFLLLGSITYAPHIFATHKDHSTHALFPVFVAEFSLSQENIASALQTYQHLVEEFNIPSINERALEVALQYNDIETALVIAKLWLQQYPQDVPAMFYLTHIALKAEQYNLAAKTLDQILKIDPNANLEGLLIGIYPESTSARQSLLAALQNINKAQNPSVLVMIAGLEAQNQEFENALKKVNIALKKRPSSPSFIIFKANLYFAANEPEKAFKWLHKINRTTPSADVALFEIQHLIKQNKTEETLKKLKIFLKKWPKNEQFLFMAGITAIDLKKFDVAEIYLTKLQYSDNYGDQANYYLAVNAERKKDFAKAIALYKSVEGNFYTISRKSMAAIYLQQNMPSDAIRFLTQERISHPNQASFLYQLQAQILKQMGQAKAAFVLLDEALLQMPEDAEIIYTQVLLLDPFKDKDRLDKALNLLINIEPNSPTFLNAYAYTLAQQNRNLDLAREYAEQALAYAPQQASILDTLGYIAFLQNDYDVAVEVLAKAFSLSPTMSIGVNYAKALYVRGDLEQFTLICEQLQTLYPNAKEVAQLQQLLMPMLPSHSS